MHRRWYAKAAVVPALAGLLVASACTSAEDESTGATGPGVTDEPCPDAVNPDKGCIYLGSLNDLEGGPFTVLGQPINQAQLDFWKQVNQAGGIGDYEINLAANTKNTSYDVQKHAAAYQQVEPNVLALAMSLGTPQTEAVLDQMDSADLVAVAGTFWSGWQFPDTDRGLVLEAGFSYCTEAVIGLDWFAENHNKPATIATVVYKGDYGGDYAAGAQKWAEANDAQVAASIETGPNAVVGNQDGPVGQIVAAAPDVVLLATGPAEAAEIVGKAVQAGYSGRFLAAGPTWNGALLRTPAAPALTAQYNVTSPFQGWDGPSEGVAAAHEATGGTPPANWGYLAGWALSYPMKALLEKANEEGKLNRAGLREAVTGLEVDYQGMVVPGTFGEMPDPTTQAATVAVPDAAAPLGTRTLVNDYKGTSTGKISYTEPCVQG
ncbi:MAG TPA: ABC transporter substrate-binding protein [Aldersonia sp.]